MKQRGMLPIALAALLTAAGLVAGAPARAAGIDRAQIRLTYHGGALIEHVKVFTLFWGEGWQRSALPGYYNGCLQALFADGRYMATLAQYSAGGYQIGNGRFMGTVADPAELPSRVTDGQIQAEVRAQIARGALPAPDADTLYMVFTPPQVVVDDGTGADSEDDFLGYHDYAEQGQFAYAVIPYEEQNVWGDPRLQTLAISHELAEAVTDPEPQLQRTGRGGWYDRKYGELGDIPVELFSQGDLPAKTLGQILTGPDGTRYVLQANWSNRDNDAVAFTAVRATAQ